MKKLLRVITMILLLLSFTAFVGCGPTEEGGGNNKPSEDDTPGQKTFTMEAEYVNLSELSGAGFSGSAEGKKMIVKDTGGSLSASNGNYVAYTNTPDLQFVFKFNAAKSGTAKVVVRLSSEVGVLTLNNNDFSVNINDKEFDYGTITIQGEPLKAAPFQDFVITTKLQVKEGENVLLLTILENQAFPGRDDTAGPLIDCVKIVADSSLNLTWQPKENNLA